MSKSSGCSTELCAHMALGQQTTVFFNTTIRSPLPLRCSPCHAGRGLDSSMRALAERCSHRELARIVCTPFAAPTHLTHGH
jgi:hypothetical protein